MMGAQAKGFVLPPGSAPKIKLTASELTLKILGYGEWEAWVEYPDGFRRHHMAHDLPTLMAKIDGQLRTRYNITGYVIKGAFKSLNTGETITLGDVTYA